IFNKASNFILGDNSIACKASIFALKKLKKFKIYYLGSSWHGEAKDCGENLASLCIQIQRSDSNFKKPAVLVWGGETTVTVRGNGKGGRNQEEALAALNVLRDRPKITIAFMGTDGKDGFSEAAGAIVDSETFLRTRARGLDPSNYLSNNDSNSFFSIVGESLIVTGPTATNVNDIGIALIE
ncbi:MAG: hypothetical protein OK439_02880, partial [Thaumarchaeota archaeon]|nr:hypothetical protein [Nitrososphaerota archaeon]